ncbi:MAG: hypothetical protein IJ389_03415 [Clostridia bacterium]|nr:hypothetical protein [Clostridia bacterium]
MTVELLQTLSVVSFIAAGVFLLTGIALFFLLDVPKLYGDISGRSAKKAIEAIRRQNDETGAGGYKASTVNAVRGKITDKITHSGRLNIVTSDLPVTVGTSKMPKANETTVLDSSGSKKGAFAPAPETTVLADNAPAAAYAPANETTVLAGNAQAAPVFGGNETALLTADAPAAPTLQPVKVGVFTIDIELAFMGTNEIIR